MTKRGGNPESHSFNPEKRSIEHPLTGIVAENKAPMWATILASHLQLGLASKCYLGSLYLGQLGEAQCERIPLSCLFENKVKNRPNQEDWYEE